MLRTSASDAPWAAATNETNRCPTSRSPKSSKAIWRSRQVWTITVAGWETTPPNWPRSRQACDEFFPDLPKPLELPPAQQRRYLFQSVSETFARSAQARAQLYILEDLHWADESSLSLFIHLANRVGQLPIVIIGTYRSGYSDENPALVRTLEELIRIGVRPQKLYGLSKEAVAQMLNGFNQRQTPESLLSLIFEESQGYPFFVEEVYRHLCEEGKVFDAAGQFRTDLKLDETDVPENLRLIISRRLERLDENEKRALAAAAVIGRSFSFQLLSVIGQIDVDELFVVIEKAQKMRIILPSSEGPERPFTFSHELVRQILLAGIAAPRRERLHAAVADGSSGSILMPSKSAPQRSQTICSRQDRSLTAGEWSAT